MSTPQDVQETETSEKRRDGRQQNSGRRYWHRRPYVRPTRTETAAEDTGIEHEGEQNLRDSRGAERSHKNDPRLRDRTRKAPAKNSVETQAPGQDKESQTIPIQEGEEVAPDVTPAGGERNHRQPPRTQTGDRNRERRHGYGGQRRQHGPRTARGETQGDDGVQNPESQRTPVVQRFDHTVQLLEARTAEWRAAQNFLSIEDQRSAADVIQLVKELNNEILGVSACLVDALPVPLKVVTLSDDGETNTAAQTVAGLIGSSAEKLLRTCTDRDQEDDVLGVLDMVFKACVTAWSCKIIEAWHFESPGQLLMDSGSLDHLYQKIYSAEEQAIAGRWRALTRRNVQNQTAETAAMCLQHIIDSLSDVLVCAGLSEGRKEAERTVVEADAVVSKLKLTTERAQILNKIIGQEITSCDLKVILGQSDSGGHTGDSYSCKGKERLLAADMAVVLTTELGLSMTVKREGKMEETNLLKPSVQQEGSSSWIQVDAPNNSEL